MQFSIFSSSYFLIFDLINVVRCLLVVLATGGRSLVISSGIFLTIAIIVKTIPTIAGKKPNIGSSVSRAQMKMLTFNLALVCSSVMLKIKLAMVNGISHHATKA